MIDLKPIRGMHDRLPDECAKISYIMSVIKGVIDGYGYKEINLPIVESTNLFKRSVGISSDIVQKEMYTFQDRNDESLTLRPEGTAGCYRAYLSEYYRSSPYQRLWYYGPMFRRERPQKGRQREFYQFGIEAFGYDHPSIDYEVIKIAFDIFSKLSLSTSVICKINFLGTTETRKSYSAALRKYFEPFLKKFDDIHKYRYEQNVLRLLDSKDEYIKTLIQDAPKISTFLSENDLATYQYIKILLKDNKIPFEEDHTLVRGLDYYSGLIYEWQASHGLGSQNTICAGGRTDKLCEILTDKEGFSLGMAMGIERLSMLVDTKSLQNNPHLFLFTDNEEHYSELYKLVEILNKNKYGAFVHTGISQLKKQLNRANKMNYKIAVSYQDKVWSYYNLENNDKLSFDSINQVMEHIDER